MYKAIYNQVYKDGAIVAQFIFPAAAARYAAMKNRGYGSTASLPMEVAAFEFARHRDFAPAGYKRLRLGYVQLYRLRFGTNPPSVKAAIEWLRVRWDKCPKDYDSYLAAAYWFLAKV